MSTEMKDTKSGYAALLEVRGNSFPFFVFMVGITLLSDSESTLIKKLSII